MADNQSAAAEIRREKKKKNNNNNKPQHENIMVCPIPYGDHKEERNRQKYNVRICYAGRP